MPRLSAQNEDSFQTEPPLLLLFNMLEVCEPLSQAVFCSCDFSQRASRSPFLKRLNSFHNAAPFHQIILHFDCSYKVVFSPSSSAESTYISMATEKQYSRLKIKKERKKEKRTFFSPIPFCSYLRPILHGRPVKVHLSSTKSLLPHNILLWLYGFKSKSAEVICYRLSHDVCVCVLRLKLFEWVLWKQMFRCGGEAESSSWRCHINDNHGPETWRRRGKIKIGLCRETHNLDLWHV